MSATRHAVRVRDGYRRAQALARAHARSFHFASLALAGARRRASFALYAFCRRLDDLVDEPRAGDDVAGRLARAHALVSAVHARRGPAPALVPAPFHPHEVAALRETVHRFAIPEAPFHELIRGVEMDLSQTRYADFAALDLYCYRVAGTVGLMMAPVLGYRDPAALGPAADLGRAMQLTNILRDVGEDLDRGRIYLPQDELAAAGVGEAQLRAGCVDARWIAFLQGQIARARRYYADARRGIPLLGGWRSRLTVHLMAVVYAEILRVIEARGYDVFRGRAAVPGRRKLALAAGVLRGARAA